MKRFFKFFLAFIGLIVAVTLTIIATVQLEYANRIHDVAHAPQKAVAIVLGASINRDGSPSDALEDRILTAADLYHASTVSAILMSGDDGGLNANEVGSMVEAARKAGIPEKAIQVDGQGYRTYESCKRAIQTLGIRSALIVTQRFHLGRALYLCNQFGMDAEGVVADRQSYVRIVFFWERDLVSSFKAFWDIHVHAPELPVKD